VAVRSRAADRHAEVQRLAAAGGTIAGIARRLGVTCIMVRRYLFADAPPERAYPPRPSMLDPYEPHPYEPPPRRRGGSAAPGRPGRRGSASRT
jgi:hypothetical protein